MTAWVQTLVNYWESRVDESGLGVDWADAANRCWRCSTQTGSLQKCHIKPRQFGGRLTRDNLIALCSRCHDEMPDTGAAEDVWDWVRDTCCPSYDQFWWARSLIAGDVFPWVSLSLEEEKQILTRLDEGLKRSGGLHAGQNRQGVFIKPETSGRILRRAYGKRFVSLRLQASKWAAANPPGVYPLWAAFTFSRRDKRSLFGV